MNREEARSVIEIMMTADHGCAVCSRDLVEQFISKYMEFINEANEVWDKEYDVLLVPKKKVSLIAAVAENSVIGSNGQLPWKIKKDLQKFKELTMGKTLIMGRRTFESIGKPLPGRTSIVISRQWDYKVPEGVYKVDSPVKALNLCKGDEAMVIGGSEIYKLFLPCADTIYMTSVYAKVEGDVTFPDVDWNNWKCISEESFEKDEENEYDFRFQVFSKQV